MQPNDRQRIAPRFGGPISVGQALSVALAKLGEPKLAATALLGLEEGARATAGTQIEFELNPSRNPKARALNTK